MRPRVFSGRNAALISVDSPCLRALIVLGTDGSQNDESDCKSSFISRELLGGIFVIKPLPQTQHLR